MNDTIAFQEQEFRVKPFQDVDEVCLDAGWRFRSICYCVGDNLSSIKTVCNHTPTNVVVEQDIQDGFVTVQTFCNEVLCVVEELNHTNGISAQYSWCHSRRHHKTNNNNHNNRTTTTTTSHNCRKRSNVCRDDHGTERVNNGFVITHGSRESLLCFQNQTVPVFMNGISNPGALSSSSSWLMRVGAFLWIILMLSMLVLFRNRNRTGVLVNRNGNHNNSNSRMRNRRSSYSDVAQHDNEETNENSNDLREVELTMGHSTLSSTPTRTTSEDQNDVLPVAYATPIQKCFESKEFVQEEDESEEWSG